jgi:hypothetical protein
VVVGEALFRGARIRGTRSVPALPLISVNAEFGKARRDASPTTEKRPRFVSPSLRSRRFSECKAGRFAYYAPSLELLLKKSRKGTVSQRFSKHHCLIQLHPEPHTDIQRRRYDERFTQTVDRWLDAGHGSCILAQPESKSIVESLEILHCTSIQSSSEFIRTTLAPGKFRSHRP